MARQRTPLCLAILLVAAVAVACDSGEDARLFPDVNSARSTPTVPPTRTARPTATVAIYPTATPIPAAPFESTRISWQGKLWYLHGANLPWFNWGCDFGCAGNGGASSPEVYAAVSRAFADAKGHGLNVVRWWMFPGEPNQFAITGAPAPATMASGVHVDIAAALRLAAQHDIYLVFVLFSAPSHIPNSWMADEPQRTQLAATIGALAGRYGSNPRVLAWEVFNEPEWDFAAGRASEPDVVATVKAITAAIHDNSPALVTVGSATIQSLGTWVDSGLDFYSPHWYDPMSPAACALCTDYASLRATYGLTKPVVIGEFYAGSDVGPAQRHADLYAKGYAGAWSWSLLPDRTEDRMAIDLGAAAQLGREYSDLGPR